MTFAERQVAQALLKCSLLPASFDKRFIRQLPNWYEREMTEKGRAMMLKLLQKYRRQVPNHAGLAGNVIGQQRIETNP